MKLYIVENEQGEPVSTYTMRKQAEYMATALSVIYGGEYKVELLVDGNEETS